MKPIIDQTIRQLVSSISGVLILLIGSIYLDLLPILYPEVIRQLPKPLLLKTLTLAILLFVLSSVLSLIFYLQLKTKLIPMYGVYWDKKGNAFCPNESCRSLLVPEDFSCFICNKCNPRKKIYPRDSNGDYVKISDAIKKLPS